MPLNDTLGNQIGPDNLGSIIYEHDYFSGSQINILFGDVLIDCAVSIQYNLSQSRTPVFGYASQYYSFCADGHKLGSGVLTIAFKESGYLMYPIQRFVNNSAKIDIMEANAEWAASNPNLWRSPRYSIDKDGNILNYYSPTDYTLTEAAKATERKSVLEQNVEQSFKSTRKDKQRFWRELNYLPDDKFEDYAETFEDAIWYGSDKANGLVRDKLFAKNIRQGVNISDDDVLSHRDPTLYPPIDIWIIYGDMSRQPSNHTVVKLLDVTFSEKTQTIEMNDQPIFEQYNFICKNIV